MVSVVGTTNFPTALDDVIALVQVANLPPSTTTTDTGGTGANGTSGTTIAVASTTGYAASGTIVIDSEIITYTAKTSLTFTGCVRGADGTTAAAHTLGAAVNGWETAMHHAVLVAALIALETKLGITSSTPTSGAFLRGSTTAGQSAWATLTVSDLNTALAATTVLLQLLGNATGTSVLKVANKAASTVDMAIFDGSATTGGQVIHFDKNGHMYFSQSAVPTTSGLTTVAGTGATCTVVGDDQSGVITLVTGTTPTSGGSTLFNFLFATALGAIPTSVVLSAASATVAALTPTLEPYIDPSFITTTAFTVTAGTGTLAASTTYKWHYRIN